MEDGDLALTGRAFAVNPNPLGILCDGTKPEEKDALKDTKKSEEDLEGEVVVGLQIQHPNPPVPQRAWGQGWHQTAQRRV